MSSQASGVRKGLLAALLSAAVAIGAGQQAQAAGVFAPDYSQVTSGLQVEQVNHRHHRRHRRHVGAGVALGVIGLATGAIIAGSVGSRAYYAPRAYPPGYYPPRVHSRAPARRGARGRYEPWTPAWYRSCHKRFRSFDARSGTYLGYDGRRHFCN